MRALLLQTAEKRIGEVLDVLFDLAINERQAWAIKEVLDRSLGKVVEARGQPEQSPQLNQVNIKLPDPPGGWHKVPGLLDGEP